MSIQGSFNAIVAVLLLVAVHVHWIAAIQVTTSVSDQDGLSSLYQCDATSVAGTTTNLSRNFYGIPSATNRGEAVATLPDREYRVLSYFAAVPLPLNDSSDDILPLKEDSLLPPTNP
jgi:hypothetical protein